MPDRERWRCAACKRERLAGDALPPLIDSINPKYRMGRCKACKVNRAFELVPGATLKAEGIAAVEASTGLGVDAAWKRQARNAALALCELRRPFTSTDITDRAGLPISRNAVGALLNGLAREGRIRKVGYANGTRPSQHARAVAVWEGV